MNTLDDFTTEQQERKELKNKIMQVIQHSGYGVGSSMVANLLRELSDYYDD